MLINHAYVKEFYASTPQPLAAPLQGVQQLHCRRSYNDLRNAAMALDGWRHYLPPRADTKPLLAASFSYTFEATDVRPRCPMRLQ